MPAERFRSPKRLAERAPLGSVGQSKRALMLRLTLVALQFGVLPQLRYAPFKSIQDIVDGAQIFWD